VYFEPFLAGVGKTLKNRINNPFRPISGTIEQLFAIFGDFFRVTFFTE
jgi:hypothetical protein